MWNFFPYECIKDDYRKCRKDWSPCLWDSITLASVSVYWHPLGPNTFSQCCMMSSESNNSPRTLASQAQIHVGEPGKLATRMEPPASINQLSSIHQSIRSWFLLALCEVLRGRMKKQRKLGPCLKEFYPACRQRWLHPELKHNAKKKKKKKKTNWE